MKDENLISLCRNMTDKQPVTVPLSTVVTLIQSDTSARESTEKFRYYESIGLAKEATKEKKNARQFIPSAICEGGTNAANIKSHTGLGMGDIDDLPPECMDRYMELLDKDPYTYLAYITYSGTGIRIIYRTDATDLRQHPGVFDAGNGYFTALLEGHAFDPHCKNLNRKSAICHDPHPIFHADAQIFHVPSAEDIASQAKPQRTKDRTKKKSHTATMAVAAPIIKEMLKAGGKEYAAGCHNDYISCAVYLMNKFGVEQAEIQPWAEENYPDFDTTELASIIQSVYTVHADEHGILKTARNNGSKYARLEDIEQFIHTQAALRYNVILGCNEICWLTEKDKDSRFHEITDRDENTLWNRSIKAGLASGHYTFQSILHSEFVPYYNPMTDYFTHLPKWDGKTDYIRQVSDRVKTNTPELFTRYFRKWFVAMAASLIQTEIVNHTIMVLIGGQGVYKTTFFEKLLPPELHRYFHVKTNARQMDKDDRLTLSESALICLEELDVLTYNELNQIKAIVTIPEIKERQVYARNKELRHHLATFCGTGNNKNFLIDDSGNRRWLNFEALSILNPHTHPLPYEGLYAQALALFETGFQYWFDETEIDELHEHNRAFEAVNIEEELICGHFRLPRPGEKGIFISTAHIWEIIGVCIKYTLNARKITTAMRKLGFEEKRRNNIHGFIVVELTGTEKLDQKKDLPELPI